MSKGRQTSNMKQDDAAVLGQHREDTKSPKSRDKPERGSGRIPMGKQKNLGGWEQYIREGFVGYGFRENRVQKALVGGYEFCKDEDNNSIYRASGDSRLVLMQIPKDMYDEDQKDKHAAAIDAMAQAAKIDTGKGETGDSEHAVTVTGSGQDPLFN